MSPPPQKSLTMRTQQQYIISGAGYSIIFDTEQERDQFSQLTEAVYQQMVKTGIYTNLTALHYSIVIATARKLNAKIETN